MKQDTRQFTHLHSSSRYDRSVGSLRRAVVRYMRDADFLTFTEVEYENREKVLRSFDGWGVATGDISPRNDSGIMWDQGVWKLIERGNTVIADIASPGQAPVAATWAVLEHRATGKKILAFVFHAPSSVEGGNGFSRTRGKVVAWWSTFRGGKSEWNRLTKKYKTDGLLVVADWNLNLKKAWVRALFKTSTPGLSLVWSGKDFPKDGTHHSRIIDFSLIRGVVKRVRNPRIYRDDDSSDHQPYIEDLRLV